MAVHPHMDLVFVADYDQHRMQSFRSDGTHVKHWGSAGTGDGEFNTPNDVAVLARPQDPTRDCIFVADYQNHRIQVFGLDGTFIRKWGSKGQGDGQFNLPSGVDVHPTQSLVYVTDQDNSRVQVFDLDGTFVRQWSVKGSKCTCPFSVVVHPTKDLVYVVDLMGGRVHAFRSDGTFLFAWGSPEFMFGEFSHPTHLDIHPAHDLLFVVEHDMSQVQVFDLDGSFMCKWGSKGKMQGKYIELNIVSDGEFFRMSGITVHPSRNEVFVCDYNGVQVFSLFDNQIKRKRRQHIE